MFRLKAMKWWTPQDYIQRHCDNAIRHDVLSGKANLAIHMMRITRCGLHRLHHLITRSWKWWTFRATSRENGMPSFLLMLQANANCGCDRAVWQVETVCFVDSECMAGVFSQLKSTKNTVFLGSKKIFDVTQRTLQETRALLYKWGQLSSYRPIIC